MSKTKVIHCVFSGSDVRSKWWLLCSLLLPTTEHLNRLGDILVYPCSDVETTAAGWQLTQDGSMLKQQCPSIVVGGALACVMSLCQESVNGLTWDSAYDLRWLKKNNNKHWVDFYHYRVVMYTHCQHTFMFKHHVKVIFFHLMSPLNHHITL